MSTSPTNPPIPSKRTKILTKLIDAFAPLMLLAFSATALGLTVNSRQILSQFKNSETLYPQILSPLDDPDRQRILFLLPTHLTYAPYDAILAASIIALFASLWSFLPIFVKNDDIAIWGRGFAAVSVVASAAALILSMVEYSKSDKVWEYYNARSYYQRFTGETWACAIRYELPLQQERFDTVCRQSRAARVMTISLFCFSALCFYNMVIFARMYKVRGSNLVSSSSG